MRGDNVFNLGEYKNMFFEMILNLIMNYPSLYGQTYIETANSKSAGIEFIVNDLLLCIMIFFRVIYFVRMILSFSIFFEPRAARVCKMYGCHASNMFAIKSQVKKNPTPLVGFCLLTSLIVFSYNLRLFERMVQPEFGFYTTSMWNILITMTTVGYGDFFAESHCGRCVAVLTAIWGNLNMSLFVLAITNLTLFDPSQ
jgi:hypothetical protein